MSENQEYQSSDSFMMVVTCSLMKWDVVVSLNMRIRMPSSRRPQIDAPQAQTNEAQSCHVASLFED